ncbi:MAG: FecR domain-containing protein [Cyclobacteriaceae bacterium]
MLRTDLLKKYIEGQLSEEEFKLLIEDLSQAEDSSAHEQLLEQLWKDSEKSTRLSRPDSRRLLGSFQSALKKEHKPQKQLFLPRFWYRAAAITGILLVGMAVWWLFKQEQRVEYITGNGETRIITLPDRSSVVLNANSRLSYDEDWSSNTPREVWLDGEAFFSVIHTQNHQHFRVNVTNELKVDVLGTEFNVKDRREKAQVVLNTGQVKLDIRDTDQPHTVIMQPGELVEFSEADKTLVKKQVDPERYAAWRNHKMIFEEMPLVEISRILEDNYGVSITIEDTLLANTRLTGAFPTHNIDMILTSLPTIIDMKVRKDGDRIIFQRK